ncbi:MAG: site-specific DNA-methyltransferase [Acidimicrobiales bacterium]|nr:site-specific DNA-methyltransferase [Acidimicrobiales bacterium]
MPADLPLSVWPTAQRNARAQRAGRYVEISGHHPAKMLPAIATRAIATYTSPGDLVLDPMAGIGSTLVEAVHLGRDAIGVEYEPQWAELARANITYARSQGATGHGEVVCGDARHVTTVADPSVRGLVALVLTSPPYGPSLHGQVTARPGHGIAKSHNRYSTDPANLAHVGLARLLDAMRTILTGCACLLRPGGFLAMTVRPWWHAGQLIDLPGAMVRVGEEAGLILYERNVALLAGLRGEQLVPRTSFFALEQVRKARTAGIPRLVTAHEDFLVFRLLPAAGTEPAVLRLAAANERAAAKRAA